jgi:hypothetical protein
LRNKKGPLTMGKAPCTDHVRGKSCTVEMRSGHGTIARVASPQRWSEGICKGKPGLSGPARECAAAVEGREGRSRVSGAGLGACRVRVRPGARPRHGHGGRPALMGRAVDAGGAGGGPVGGRELGPGCGRRGAGGGGEENCAERAALGGAKPLAGAAQA